MLYKCNENIAQDQFEIGESESQYTLSYLGDFVNTINNTTPIHRVKKIRYLWVPDFEYF